MTVQAWAHQEPLYRTANFSNDWLYGRQTVYCDRSLVYDQAASDIMPRLVMGVIWLFALVLIWLMPTRQPTGSAPADECSGKEAAHTAAADVEMGTAVSIKAPKPEKKRERWFFLDVVRIAAVACVVTEHGGGLAYSARNVGFTAQWVLASLFLTSGISFMLSQTAPLRFYLRLGVVFGVGVMCNVIGAVAATPDWYDDIGNTSIYQMFYIVAIACLGVLAMPMRAVLRDVKCEHQTLRLGVFTFYGLLWVPWVLLYLFIEPDFNVLAESTLGTNGTSSWGSGRPRQILAQMPFMLTYLLGFPALVSWHAFLRRKADGTLTWLMLAYAYVPAILVPVNTAYAHHVSMLYLLGVLHQGMPLRAASRLAVTLRAYWLFVFLALLMLYTPNLLGRCDLYPALTLWERFRWYASEAILMTLLLTQTLVAADPHKIVPTLNMWALFAYCTHVMWIRLMPEPYGVVTTYAFVPLFFLVPAACRLFRQPSRVCRNDRRLSQARLAGAVPAEPASADASARADAETDAPGTPPGSDTSSENGSVPSYGGSVAP